MSLVNVARDLVVRTNRWPGLKTLYRQAYDLGLAFTVNRLSGVPGILAVMLRVNDGGRAWVPGLSDYDVTVLTERHEGLAAIRFLDRLWQRYRSIKRSVPQLGEMEVMDVEEYGDFLDFGPIPNSSLKHAHPLFAKAGNADVVRVLQRVPRRPQQQEFLLDALSRYGRFAFPASLDAANRGNSLTRRRAEHLLGSVSKRLAPLGVPAETASTGTIADRMVLVFQALSQTCRLMKPTVGEPATVVEHDASAISNDAILPIQAFSENVLRQAAVRHCSVVAWRAYMSADRVNLHFIVPDDVSEEELRGLLLALGALNRADFPCPTVLASDSMWRCWRELAPFDGVAIASTERSIVGMVDGSRATPSLTALRRGAEVQYAVLLALKNNWRLSQGRPSWQSYATFVNHAKGYASASTGRVLTRPTAVAFTSTEDGYLAATEALKTLRASLVRHVPSAQRDTARLGRGSL